MIQPRRPPISKRAVVLASLVVLLLLVIGSTRFYTDILWFNEVGISSVLWTSLRTQFAVGIVVGLITALVVWLNLWIAGRLAPTYVRPSLEGRPDPLGQYREVLRPFIGWIRLGAALLVGLSAGVAAGAAWRTFLLWSNKVPFGQTDPQFGRDISFFVFELPFLHTISDWLWFAVMASLLTTIAAHYFFGSVRPEMGWRGVLPGALAHISVLLGTLALIKAYQYHLGTFDLNFSARGQVTGASYTDVNAQLPALKLLVIISVISALLFLVNIKVRRLSLPIAAVGIWILTAFLAGTVWPFVVQRFSVEPQEPQRERPYIERNLTATRDAFGLSDIEEIPYAATSAVTPEGVAANEATLQNVRLWDPSVLKRAYEQLQAIRTYYQFKDVDVDRYEIAGEKRQVLLSARELSIDDIPDRSKTWQNVHLQYTHGYGLVASLANASTVAGQPSFLVREVPETVISGAEALQAEQPRIYYGEGFQSNEYSIVNSKQDELDYPLEAGSVERTNYSGEGGIGVGNLFRRLAFAIRERDPNLVLSSLIAGESKILIYRNVRDRVLRAAPFLSIDSDPYPAVVDGKVQWILDGYTTTKWYPYSERFDAGDATAQSLQGTLDGSINYIRNSVKITVDAYDGTMKFYIVDESDPLIQAWRNIFPSLFTDEEPSEDLVAHFRYPEDLFRLQTEVYRTYHMTDPLDFYAKEDEWNIPLTPEIESFNTTTEAGSEVAPVYLLFRPPGETDERFVITRPFVPRGRSNMISLLVASSDPGSYGELQSLEFPRSKSVLGPQQVDNLINQDVNISPTLSLLRQRGSDVQFGSLVILPIEDALLYVQPIFVTASSGGSTTDVGGIPELKFVAMVLGEDVVMASNFGDALAELFDVSPVEPTEPTDPTDPTEPTDPGTPSEIAALIEQATELYADAQDALAAGDFAEYGRLIEELGQVLSDLGAASGGGSDSSNNANSNDANSNDANSNDGGSNGN